VGQKVHPFGFRLGFNKTWKSLWYADKDYAKLLHEDIELKRALKKRFAHAGVSKLETSRAANRLKVDIYTSRPGISAPWSRAYRPTALVGTAFGGVSRFPTCHGRFSAPGGVSPTAG